MALDADRNGHFNKREFHHALITLGKCYLEFLVLCAKMLYLLF